MTTIILKKPKTLEYQILSLKVGQKAFISNKDYKPMSVRNLVMKLNKNGYSYAATEKEVIDGIYVIKLK